MSTIIRRRAGDHGSSMGGPKAVQSSVASRQELTCSWIKVGGGFLGVEDWLKRLLGIDGGGKELLLILDAI
jgi:hypothetical protein